MRLGFVVGTFFAGIGLYIVFTRTIPGMQEQQRCRDWLKENNFQTVEGVIANYPATRPNKSSITFDVSGHRFTVGGLNRVRGGFNLRFTGSGLEELQLQNGMAVRISHREGRILRIEIAE